MTDEVGRGTGNRNPSGRRRDLPNSLDRRNPRARRGETDSPAPTAPPAPVSEPAIKISLGEQVEVATTSVYTRQKKLTPVGQGSTYPSLPLPNPLAPPEKPELP